MAKNNNVYYLSVSAVSAVFFLLAVTVELYMPQGASARKLLQNEPDTNDGGQHKIGANGSTSRHAGSATGDNDTSGSVQLSPPTALTYIVHLENGSTMTVSVPYPHIDFSFVPPGIPIPNVPIPHVDIPHIRPPPPPSALGFFGGNNPMTPRQYPPSRPWFGWP